MALKQASEPWLKAALFQRLWQTKYLGEPYIINGMVLKWAKELVGVDDELIEERLKVFFNDEWYGENTRHSLPAFVKNFNSFVPKSRRRDGTLKPAEPVPIEAVKHLFDKLGGPMSVEKRKDDPNEQYRCPDCNTVHARGFKC